MYNEQKEEVYEGKSNGATESIPSHTNYVEFITTFGGAYAGIAVHAFSNGSSIGNETVVNLALDFRQQFLDYLPPNILATNYVYEWENNKGVK
ncbi:hypothetical protein U1P98_03770 [Lysinibacillus irui]|uniref:Uncharacterized protein n=1 Tax=Lysinibacillus irui TaxID=2998077 RepID=A0ABU5NH98_9BACI|nr:hypothetical protein [Lysinibacillus irui]MEA0552827.1 hypothetical protein [Lysinibacillus irui]MEA0565898.1 hypothetical protein [Lysinibacillus irui]MEA0975407.1 hypothetical protein [Lysinibacillus irui]MEA1041561.1 hypothetical protein [Lysinibacillus irui]